jgi:ABC-2 type transport system ATP-binding protein
VSSGVGTASLPGEDNAARFGDGATALRVERVHKSYGGTIALAGVDLTVAAGTILGLLGPNGAGKTSLVSIIAGLRRPDTGRVFVGDVDVARAPQRARQLIGLAPQETGVYLPLSVRDNLRFFAGLTGLRKAELRERIAQVANALGLGELLDRRASELSGGERRRLHTAIALVHRPSLVLLDEPTTGADVRTRSEILQLVRSLADDGSAVVYSTHYLQEIEELDASVAVIDRGRIVARGGRTELIARYGSSALELTFEQDVPAVARIEGATVDGSVVRIPTADPAVTAAQLLPHLGRHTDALRSIEIVRPSLESVFLTLTGRHFAEHAIDPVR